MRQAVSRTFNPAALVLLLSRIVLADPALPAPPPAEVIPVRPHQIDRLKRDIIAYIYKGRNPQGTWEENQPPKQFAAGNTALAVYALLAAGESPQDPRLRPAIDWLKKANVDGTYVAAARLNACSYLPLPSVQEAVKADHRYLVAGQLPLIDPATKTPEPGAGLYDYSNPPKHGNVDHSVSQFAVLGMWLCEQMGFAAPRDYWRNVEMAWLRDQNEDGGWCYNMKGGASTGSMTAAGVATLFITQDYVRLHTGAVVQGNYRNEQLERGLAWLAEHFLAGRNPSADAPAGNTNYHYYWLYACERVGIAGGLKYIGTHNWYDEGARVIAKCDRQEGFKPDGGGESQITDACFALLFLSRGQKPVLVNKLRYDGDWNHRPRDAANITRWYGKRFESELLWQVVRIDENPREFHDAPVLYLNGYGALHFTPEEKKKLKSYIEDGGFLMVNAQGQDKALADSAAALLGELFPQYPVRPLPASHPIVSGAYKPKKPLQVLGQSNGIRELAIILAERDIPAAWQQQKEKLDPDAYEAAANIFFYASDRNRLRIRGETNIVIRDPQVRARQQAALARIQHGGNWDPEPGGWRRMQAILHNQNEVNLAVEVIPLDKLNLEGYQFAHITGTAPVKLTPENLAELRKFIISGGTLIVDAANGSSAFLESIEADLDQLIPNLRFTPLTEEDPLLADTHPFPEPEPHIFPEDPELPRKRSTGEKKLEVEYRRFAKANAKDASKLQLKGIRVGRRYAILLSPFDLSAGLVGQNIDGVMGYTPATATEMMRRILVNSLPKPR